jgi:hypothetical protein
MLANGITLFIKMAINYMRHSIPIHAQSVLSNHSTSFPSVPESSKVKTPDSGFRRNDERSYFKQ